MAMKEIELKGVKLLTKLDKEAMQYESIESFFHAMAVKYGYDSTRYHFYFVYGNV